MPKTISTISIKLNESLANAFKECCAKRDYTVSGAITSLASNYIKNGVLPFPLGLERSYPNENIKKTSLYIDGELKTEFSAKCKENNLNMNKTIRAFMDYCVSNDCLPLEVNND